MNDLTEQITELLNPNSPPPSVNLSIYKDQKNICLNIQANNEKGHHAIYRLDREIEGVETVVYERGLTIVSEDVNGILSSMQLIKELIADYFKCRGVIVTQRDLF